jgi:hypothetical protein
MAIAVTGRNEADAEGHKPDTCDPNPQRRMQRSLAHTSRLTGR